MRLLLLIAMLLSGTAHGDGGVLVRDAWLRGMPPGQSNTAAYMILVNDTSADRSLVAVSSPSARSVEVHESVQVEGMWRMRRLERVTVAAGSALKLQPGGIHLMVFGLGEESGAGGEIEFHLHLDNGDVITAMAELRRPGAGGGHH